MAFVVNYKNDLYVKEFKYQTNSKYTMSRTVTSTRASPGINSASGARGPGSLYFPAKDTRGVTTAYVISHLVKDPPVVSLCRLKIHFMMSRHIDR